MLFKHVHNNVNYQYTLLKLALLYHCFKAPLVIYVVINITIIIIIIVIITIIKIINIFIVIIFIIIVFSKAPLLISVHRPTPQKPLALASHCRTIQYNDLQIVTTNKNRNAPPKHIWQERLLKTKLRSNSLWLDNLKEEGTR